MSRLFLGKEQAGIAFNSLPLTSEDAEMQIKALEVVAEFLKDIEDDRRAYPMTADDTFYWDEAKDIARSYADNPATWTLASALIDQLWDALIEAELAESKRKEAILRDAEKLLAGTMTAKEFKAQHKSPHI